jgi:hypothetical protein
VTKARPALLRDAGTELAFGVGLFIASAWLIYDAYERRGRTRPFAARILLP